MSEGTVAAVHIWPPGTDVPEAVQELTLDWGGAIGDRHHGVTMSSDVRQKEVFARGTEIRNHRQLSVVDLHAAGCDLITITQYLRPTPRHHPVERWVPPDDFVAWADRARAIGFAGVMSGPLVRSSYRAGRLYAEALAAREAGRPA